MQELFNATFSTINILPTCLMIFILLYWITVILGLLHFNSIDINIDADVDMDAHVDVDADHHLSVSWLNYFLSFFNIGKIPFMIFLSFFVLPLWIISITANHYLNNSSIIISIIYLIPNFFVSLLIAKILTTPFVKIFNKLDEDEHEDFTGKTAVVNIPPKDDKPGQILIKHHDVPVLKYAITSKNTKLKYNEKVLIIDYIKEKDCFLIEPYEE